MKKLIAFLLCALVATSCNEYGIAPVVDVPADSLVLVK